MIDHSTLTELILGGKVTITSTSQDNVVVKRFRCLDLGNFSVAHRLGDFNEFTDNEVYVQSAVQELCDLINSAAAGTFVSLEINLQPQLYKKVFHND